MSPVIITDGILKNSDVQKFHLNSNSSIFQSTEMYEVYEKTKQYNPKFLTAYSKKTNEILGTLLSLSKTEKGGILQYLSTHISIRGGPVFKKDFEGILALKGLLKYHSLFLSKRSVYNRIYNNQDIKKYQSVYEKESYNFENYLNFIINLKANKEEVFSRISKSKQKKIKRCIREGVEVSVIKNLSNISDFYNCLKKNFIYSGWGFPNIDLFENVYNYLVPKKMAIFHLAKYKNKIIAGRVSLLYKKKIYAWYIGMDYEYSNLGVNTYLNWKLMEWGIDNDYTEFDFGGAGRPDEDFGIRKYKSEFGGSLVKYGRFTRVNNNFTENLSKIGYKTYHKILKDK